MRGVNKVILVGTVGRDPEVKTFAGGSGSVATLSMATSESWKDKNTGQTTEQTEWHRVVFYGRLAEIVGEYVSKGSKLYVEGSLHTRKWQDKNTGQDRYSTEINAASMQLLDGKPQGGNRGEGSYDQEAESYQERGHQGRQQASGRQGNQQAGGRNQRQGNYYPQGDLDDDLPF